MSQGVVIESAGRIQPRSELIEYGALPSALVPGRNRLSAVELV